MKEEKEGGRRGEEKRKEDERHSFLCSKHSSKCCINASFSFWTHLSLFRASGHVL